MENKKGKKVLVANKIYGAAHWIKSGLNYGFKQEGIEAEAEGSMTGTEIADLLYAGKGKELKNGLSYDLLVVDQAGIEVIVQIDDSWQKKIEENMAPNWKHASELADYFKKILVFGFKGKTYCIDYKIHLVGLELSQEEKIALHKSKGGKVFDLHSEIEKKINLKKDKVYYLQSMELEDIINQSLKALEEE